MGNDEKYAEGIQAFESLLASASQIPGVQIDREKYLIGALSKKFSPEVVASAIDSTPAAAGITPDQIGPIADASIRYESTKVTALSAVAGIPGGLAMAGTVPADMAQYFAHILRIAQKLAFLYGWDNIFSGASEDTDDETRNLMVLFVGVMFGAAGAQEAVAKISETVAKAIAQQLPKRALTKGTIYPVVKKVAGFLGIQMTKEVFGKSVAKVVPFIGGVVSGGITLATFAPMSLRLKDYLAGLEVANPRIYVVDAQAAQADESYEE